MASVPATGTAAKAIRQSGGGIVVMTESPLALSAAVQDLYTNSALAAGLGHKGRQFNLLIIFV
ncbi:hypothetical protein [Iningainema tapete]|uniref:Uncharacterized protein n=1 Tax=Iningainema tapete BLCC-T55 TaxID=2748662 RepID=A0A8J6XH85_9CYAN|nr:hypothetical protein [Iningainema tapete]MBD2772106.1 hypothetical protein [Iningainema tapete BLCC-T55]